MISTRFDASRPWDGVGATVLESMTTDQVLKAAGLDWEIDRRPLYYADSHRGDRLQLQSHYAIVNTLTDAPIGICGRDYQPIQNAKAFDFFTKFVERGEMKMEAAGSFKTSRGIHIWALAALKHEFELPGQDLVKGYVLLSHPHIWGQTLQIKPTAMRIYCYNSLMAALRGDDGFKHWHTREFTDDAVNKARDVVSATIRHMDSVKETANFLSKKPAKLEQVATYVAELFQPGLIEANRQVATITQEQVVQTIDPIYFNKNSYKVWESVFKSPGAHAKSAEGTWWGAFNGVTYAVDHLLGRSRDIALSDAWLGARATKKTEALRLAVEYAKAA